jgi:hypothetical protein
LALDELPPGRVREIALAGPATNAVAALMLVLALDASPVPFGFPVLVLLLAIGVNLLILAT